MRPVLKKEKENTAWKNGVLMFTKEFEWWDCLRSLTWSLSACSSFNWLWIMVLFCWCMLQSRVNCFTWRPRHSVWSMNWTRKKNTLHQCGQGFDELNTQKITMLSEMCTCGSGAFQPCFLEFAFLHHIDWQTNGHKHKHTPLASPCAAVRSPLCNTWAAQQAPPGCLWPQPGPGPGCPDEPGEDRRRQRDTGLLTLPPSEDYEREL